MTDANTLELAHDGTLDTWTKILVHDHLSRQGPMTLAELDAAIGPARERSSIRKTLIELHDADVLSRERVTTARQAYRYSLACDH